VDSFSAGFQEMFAVKCQYCGGYTVYRLQKYLAELNVYLEVRQILGLYRLSLHNYEGQ
jgi:hypothetical protein